MEGIVQLVLMVTTFGNKGKIVYLTSANNLKFKKSHTGDRLIIKTKLLGWKELLVMHLVPPLLMVI